MEVIGIEKVDYVSKSGKRVVGCKLHMCYENEKVFGKGVISEFVPERIDMCVKVGDTIELFYNKFGQVNKVSIS